MVDHDSAEIIAEHILTRDDVLADISDHVQHGRAWLYYEGGNGYFLCSTLREIYRSWNADDDFTFARFKSQFFAENQFEPRVVNAATMRYAVRLAKQREQEEGDLHA